MTAHAVIFGILGVITAVFTVGVVAARRVLHAALALAGALLGTAGIFVFLGSEFVGLVQILVYVGAVVVLFLFGIMLTASGTAQPKPDNNQRLLAAGVAFGVFGVLATGILASIGRRPLALDAAVSTEQLGQDLFTTWILPFEAVSVLLLAALVGAIVLARRD
ncbi:MAG TPA: NADH-quinone oxidoreductase subunit J [Actinomycetota bacterium]|nr:NADH-quinone oxidoreductase subunit J [Actinomycetota bacterium]